MTAILSEKRALFQFLRFRLRHSILWLILLLPAWPPLLHPDGWHIAMAKAAIAVFQAKFYQ
jgi:hypothetical protein